MTPPQPAVAIDCHVRASVPTDSVRATLGAVRGYERAGIVDDLTVQTWPDEVALTGSPRNAAVERFEAFRAWADRHGVRICPPFAVRDRASLVDDGTPTLVLPALCVAIRVDGELTGVVPHRTGTTEYTVDDVLDDLTDRDGDPAPVTPAAPGTDT